MFLELAEAKGEEQRPALYTFVRGKGYVAFEGDRRADLPYLTPDQVADWDYGKPEDEA